MNCAFLANYDRCRVATLLWLPTLTRPTVNCEPEKYAKPYEAVCVQLAVQSISVYVSCRLRFWESAERLTRHGPVDGVAIVAFLSCKESGGEDQLILESQFRPSQGKYVIEVRGLLCPMIRAYLAAFSASCTWQGGTWQRSTWHGIKCQGVTLRLVAVRKAKFFCRITF